MQEVEAVANAVNVRVYERNRLRIKTRARALAKRLTVYEGYEVASEHCQSTVRLMFING